MATKHWFFDFSLLKVPFLKFPPNTSQNGVCDMFEGRESSRMSHSPLAMAIVRIVSMLLVETLGTQRYHIQV